MGASSSVFQDNQALIDALKDAADMPSEVERVMRLVDRGCYAVEPKDRIYSDSAWRADKLHLSAPGIYLTVLRELNVQRGQSVLNVGSGTGYLSTMFGLQLGSNGVNHGIEISESNVSFARGQLVKFMDHCDAVYERDFCAPHFMVGNIFSLVPPVTRTAPPVRTAARRAANQDIDMDDADDDDDDDEEEEEEDDDALGGRVFYPPTELQNDVRIGLPPLISEGTENDEPVHWPTYDRIYVGAEVASRSEIEAILRLLSIGGRLVAPLMDQFVMIERTGPNSITANGILHVNFASLVPPQHEASSIKPPPKRCVERLERLACRSVRRQLRAVITQRHNGPPVLGHFEEDRRPTPAPPEQRPSPPPFTCRPSASPSSSSAGTSPCLEPSGPAAVANQKEESRGVSSSGRGASPPKRQKENEDDVPIAVDVVDGPSGADRVGEAEAMDVGNNSTVPPGGESESRGAEREEDDEEEEQEEGDEEEEVEEEDDDDEGSRRSRRVKAKRPALKWVDPSYTYREEIRRILVEDLEASDYTAQLILDVL